MIDHINHTMKTPLLFRQRARERAFTLIELLSVIAIIAILAGITVSGVRYTIMSAKKSAASSNMRQVFQGMLLYTTDHRGQLPGPASIAVYPWVNIPVNNGHTAHLGNYLAPYLSPSPSMQFQFLDVLRVPGSPAEKSTDLGPASFVKLDVVETSPDNIWGQWAGSFQQAQDAKIRPKRIAELTETARRSSIMTTADSESWLSPANAAFLSPTGIYNGKRLHLFIDGTIELSSALRVVR
jgi:prepilin-type N-terminal cleavage/methylation domain-containing protein